MALIPSVSPSVPSAPSPPFPFTVGFDLDMTLIDSQPGVLATHRALSAETGVFIDADLAVTRLGPPLRQELAHWFPAEQVPGAEERFRELYARYGIEATPAMPGARAALDAVRRHGGRAIVVTGKYQPNAKLHLDRLDLRADAVVGSLWAEAKAEALHAYGAEVYVGDHVGDVRGAAAAGALSVAVATGPFGTEELRAAGADTVLPDLGGFPGRLAAWLADRVPAEQVPADRGREEREGRHPAEGRAVPRYGAGDAGGAGGAG